MKKLAAVLVTAFLVFLVPVPATGETGPVFGYLNWTGVTDQGTYSVVTGFLTVINFNQNRGHGFKCNVLIRDVDHIKHWTWSGSLAAYSLKSRKFSVQLPGDRRFVDVKVVRC
jgi:hypothetical protein